MKNKLLLLLFAFTLTVTAQEENKQTEKNTSRFGIKGGYNLASIKTDSNGTTDNRHGFHIGIFGESFISDFFSIQPELMYSQQGYKIENELYELEQRLNYLNLPIMLKVYPDEAFYLELGPQVGYAISHKEELKSNILTTTKSFEPNSFDWGVNAGLGFRSRSGFSIGARYHLGLGKIYEDSDTFNRLIQFSCGLDF
ncbi:porin family protein [Pseudofulvibacter geojedonensis]|uniref:Porin family protein n=1 Tax=Pseudofulvibacter geojedonensis TaxID=1123758 RepID=A0ABW3I224_9FLAO